MKKTTKLLVSLLTFILITSDGVFTVDQRQYAVIFQFGEAMRVITDPGIHIKIPFIQKLEFFDKRILTVDVEAKELTASDEKRVIIDAFVKFKIIDPIIFYKTIYSPSNMKIRLNKILESSMRKVIGRINFTLLLSSERTGVMLEIKKLVDQQAKSFGIDVVDVRISRADLPKENSAAIYKRMQTEREKEAKQIRAEGQEEAARIRSKAEKEGKIILAQSYMEAQIIKGEGDKTAAKIYNTAFSKDPEFYRFYKALHTSKSIFEKKADNTFVLPPDCDLLKFLNLTSCK
ncbi:MAG: protease modulator HflC [Amoebophilaceae bacterium]|nr:protease modulator HflC [Amoebophilaceae bacterium]